MSKTTTFLVIILFIFLGVLLYVMYGIKQNSIITSLTKPLTIPLKTADTSLSFSTDAQAIQPGQTITTAVLIHNPDPHTSLAQLEIAFDPTIFTVDSVTPGPFFTNPTIALQKIDPITGRISYALRCPTSPSTNAETACSNSSSSTIAIITLSVNTYTLKNTTLLSFLPKTVIRTQNGRDILQSSSKLQLTIGKQLYPVSSTSAIASPGANYIRVTPIR